MSPIVRLGLGTIGLVLLSATVVAAAKPSTAPSPGWIIEFAPIFKGHIK